jgi:outer membrane protein TolC
MRAAPETVRQRGLELASTRAGYLPTFSIDYFYGIDANQYAIWGKRDRRCHLGSVVQGTLLIPAWNWERRAAECGRENCGYNRPGRICRRHRGNCWRNISTFYQEPQVVQPQLDALRRSLDLSDESLRWTLRRYEAGEPTVLEGVNAQSTLATARNAYDDGLVRYRVALVALQTLTAQFGCGALRAVDSGAPSDPRLVSGGAVSGAGVQQNELRYE